MKILLVEDSKFLRVSTERVLKTAGYEVISAADGEQAPRLAREQLKSFQQQQAVQVIHRLIVSCGRV